MNSRKSAPLELKVHIASTDSSPRASVSLDEVPEDITMTDANYIPSRPLSVAIPRTFGAQGPYCPRRPNLSEILANESPPPWTLSAFMAYLSQNHCLETLEFTMDASRYGKHYTKMVGRLPNGVLLPQSQEADYLKMLWQRLLEAYIAPNGPREVNLPSEVRSQLLHLVDSMGDMPPPPDALDLAVQHIYALMEESVLVPFLNSYYPQTAHPDYNNSSDENLNSASAPSQQSYHSHSQSASAHPFSSRSYDERGFYRRSNRRSSPHQQNQPMSASYSSSSHSSSNRASAPSTFTQLARGLSVRGFPSNPSQRSSASPYSAHATLDSKSPSPADTEMTDDLVSTVSTSSSNGGPVVGLHTPPTTPPMSDCQPYEGSPLSATVSSPTGMESPREGAWKRVGTKLGLRKSQVRSRSGGSPDGVLREEE